MTSEYRAKTSCGTYQNEKNPEDESRSLQMFGGGACASSSGHGMDTCNSVRQGYPRHEGQKTCPRLPEEADTGLWLHDRSRTQCDALRKDLRYEGLYNMTFSMGV